MKIELNSEEVIQALKPYIQSLFNREINDCKLFDENSLIIDITFKDLSEDSTEPSKSRKVKSSSRKSTSTETELEEKETDNVEPTKYADLPRLNPEDQKVYTSILELLNNNPKNKHRQELEELTSNITGDLATVLNANEHYQNWLELCKNTETKESKNTDKPKSEMDLIKEVIEENPEPEESNTTIENSNETLPIKSSTTTVKKDNPLFTPQSNVNKTGSLFSSSPKKVF